MKQAMRLTAAAIALQPFAERAMRGQPLPKHADPDFGPFAAAVSRVAHGREFQFLGQVVIAELGSHVLAELERAR